MKYEYGNLGDIIGDCIQYGINVEDRKFSFYIAGNRGVKCGKFIFSASRHSTGISVTVTIEHPSGKSYEIINGCYWFSESTYGFNKFKWVCGKWDESLKEAILELKKLLSDAEIIRKGRDDEFIVKKQAAEQKEKEEFEQIF